MWPVHERSYILPQEWCNFLFAMGVNRSSLIVGLDCGLDRWTGSLDWIAGLDRWTGLLDWIAGLDCWTGLLDWIAGLDCWTGF